jgi:hypothetical protein
MSPSQSIKHGKYISELKTGYSMFKQVTAPQIGVFGERDLGGVNFSLGWSFLTEPFLMVADAHKHDFDQLLLFFGGDPKNIGEFGGEVDIYLEGKKNSINYPASVFIPAGVMHCPLDIRKVKKPFMFIDITFSPGPSVRPLPTASRRDE